MKLNSSINSAMGALAMFFAVGAYAAPPAYLVANSSYPSIVEGSTTWINWDSGENNQCKVTDTSYHVPASPILPSHGSWETPAPSKNTMFFVTCSNKDGYRDVIVNIEVKPKPPTVDYRVNPLRIKAGETVTRSWTSQNATSCQSKTGTPLDTSGVWVTAPVYQSNTYAITCMGPGGSVTKSVDVTVDP